MTPRIRPIKRRYGSFLESLQQFILPFVAVFQTDQEHSHTHQNQRDHDRQGDGEGGAPQCGGRQQSPGAGQEGDDKKTPEGDVGEPGQNADQVVGEEGEEKGQNEKYVLLAAHHVQVALDDGMADHAVHKGLPQAPGQQKDHHGPQYHRAPGEQEGDPGAEQHAPCQGGDVAGDGGQDHREELEQEKEQVGIGGEALNIVPHGLLRGERLEKAALPEQQPSARQQQRSGQQGNEPFPFHRGPSPISEIRKDRMAPIRSPIYRLPCFAHIFQRYFIKIYQKTKNPHLPVWPLSLPVNAGCRSQTRRCRKSARLHRNYPRDTTGSCRFTSFFYL